MSKLSRVLFASIAFNFCYIIPVLRQLSSQNLILDNYGNKDLIILNEKENIKNMLPKNEKENLKNVFEQMQEKMKNATKDNKCALLFFGLPRCFGQAYESIKVNILDINPQCDAYLHTYNIQSLPANIRNNEKDTKVNITNVYLLTNNVTMSTMKEFHKQRDVRYYRKFFPKNQQWVYPTSMDNMIKQWHSIEYVWNYMESKENYTHVGLFRTDQLYKTPINIIQETLEDYAIRADYGAADVEEKMLNDRLFYGSYKYAKIWATYRFSFVPEYLKLNMTYVMDRGLHSETFLYYLMKKYVPVLKARYDICAYRIRNDCRVRKECGRGRREKRRAEKAKLNK